ncbi:unnamed protein product, partial [Mesorhabditis spiculigera]
MFVLSFLLFFPFVLVGALGLERDQCGGYDGVRIFYRDDHSLVRDPGRYEIKNTTITCFQSLKRDALQAAVDPSVCPPSTAVLNVGPVRIIPDRLSMLPYMTMNITVDVFVPFDWLYVQMECLQASDQEDQYCHNPNALMHSNGHTISPCRALSLKGSRPILPIRFNYDCFRLYGFSQYRINATLYPSNCQVSLLATVPSIGDIFPEDVKINQMEEWAPLVMIDISESDGVWVRFSPPEYYIWQEMQISVAERTLDSKALRIIEDFVVKYPVMGIKWKDAPLGHYTVFVYVPRHDCRLICEGQHNVCKVCIHTPINFTLSEHKASIPWRTVRGVKDAGFFVLAILLAVVLMVGVGGCAVLAFLRRRALKNPRSFELTERPTVCIIFADDCQEHSDVVTQLGASIRRLANANVLIDQEQLGHTGDKPTRWLLNALTSSSRILIVISPTVPELLSRAPSRRLIQRRPIPDLFSHAIDMICSDAALQGRRDRFALLRLPYSPPTPPELRLLGLPSFEMPSELVQLTTFLHGVQAATAIHPLDPEERSRVQAAISRFTLMTAKNPRWMDVRFTAEVPDHAIVDIVDVPLKTGNSATLEPRKTDAELGLLEPGDDSDEEKQPMEDTSGFVKPARPKRSCATTRKLYEEVATSSAATDSEYNASEDERMLQKRYGKKPRLDSSTDTGMSELEDEGGGRPSRHALKKRRKQRGTAVELPHACSKCPMRFLFPNKLKLHFESKHSDKHGCTRCGDRFAVFEELRKHWATAHRRVYKCGKCDYQHHTKSQLRRHVHKQHQLGILCPFPGCDAAMSAWRMGQHIKKAHAEVQGKPEPGTSNIPRCPSCEYQDSNAETLELHVDRAHRSGFMCPVDGCDTHLYLSGLTAHFNSFHPSAPLEDGDEERDEEFSSLFPGDMSPRREAFTEEETGDEMTTSPPKNNNSLSNGLALDSYKGPHACEYCPKTFPSAYRKQKHCADVHDKRYARPLRPKAYACSQCDQAFTSPGRLQDHLNTHTGATPFGCPKCDRAFTARAHLAKHLKKFHLTSIKDLKSVEELGASLRTI